ncbi:hypothetical protein [Bacillus mesophilum]|uniref:Uncharacterized protein n=1 Tax=Bacillus mesophilum TaxID=1071718 RepID=A0A7V7UVQ7_9BACI|nr:hypothetical protein [Bacillus mesophilum]KAB2332765.1 hypothetical protein F7732_11820 [Bacillus mesophilum]
MQHSFSMSMSLLKLLRERGAEIKNAGPSFNDGSACWTGDNFILSELNLLEIVLGESRKDIVLVSA